MAGASVAAVAVRQLMVPPQRNHLLASPYLLSPAALCSVTSPFAEAPKQTGHFLQHLTNSVTFSATLCPLPDEVPPPYFQSAASCFLCMLTILLRITVHSYQEQLFCLLAVSTPTTIRRNVEPAFRIVEAIAANAGSSKTQSL